jgi:hypothetical protein
MPLCCCLNAAAFMLLPLCCCLYAAAFMLLHLCCCIYAAAFVCMGCRTDVVPGVQSCAAQVAAVRARGVIGRVTTVVPAHTPGGAAVAAQLEAWGVPVSGVAGADLVPHVRAQMAAWADQPDAAATPPEALSGEGRESDVAMMAARLAPLDVVLVDEWQGELQELLRCTETTTFGPVRTWLPLSLCETGTHPPKAAHIAHLPKAMHSRTRTPKHLFLCLSLFLWVHGCAEARRDGWLRWYECCCFGVFFFLCVCVCVFVCACACVCVRVHARVCMCGVDQGNFAPVVLFLGRPGQELRMPSSAQRVRVLVLTKPVGPVRSPESAADAPGRD